MLLLHLALSIAAAAPQPAAGLEIAAVGERTSYDVELFVRADGNLYLADDIVLDLDVVRELERLQAEAPDLRVVVAADEGAPHGRVVQVLQLVSEAGVGRVALEVAGVETTTTEDTLFPGQAELGGVAVTQLDSGLTADQLRQLKPKRHRFPQNPYASTDFTAYTVERGETRVGLFNVQHGVLPRTQVGTVPLLDLGGVLNANVKTNLMREGRIDGALFGNLYLVPFTDLVERYSEENDLGLKEGEQLFTTNITVIGLGAMSSLQVTKPWSIHAGFVYNRVSAKGMFNFDDLPEVLVPGGDDATGGEVMLVPRLIGELVQLKFATDVRFNRRDSLVLQVQAPIYAGARGAFGAEVAGIPELENLDFVISYSDFVSFSEAYRASLSWQFSWKHVDLRAGIGSSPIPGTWLLQAFDLSYRFGGETRREERDIRRGYRENKRDLRESG